MRRPALAPLIVGCAGFLQAFDSNAVSVALPAIARGFGVPPLSLGTVIAAYLVGAAAFLPLCGWLAGRLGARRLFLTAIALFALTSAACGLAPDITTLTAARFAQGCAGAMLLPVGRIIVLAQTPKTDLLRAMGMMTTPIVLGPLLGPPIGGLIVTAASWRWLFLLNIPIAIGGLILVRACIPPLPPGARRPLDVRGILLLAAGLVGLTYGVSLVARPASREEGAMFVAGGLVCAIGYLRHERRHPHPIVPAALFARISFAASNIGGLFPRLLVSAVPFLLAMLFQIGFGLSAAASGGLIVAAALGSLPARWIVSAVLARWPFRRALTVNALLAAISVAACAGFTTATPHWMIMAVLFAQGLLRSLQLLMLMALGYMDVGASEMPEASTIASLSQQVAMSVGIAIVLPAIEAARLYHGDPIVAARSITPVFLSVALLSLGSLAWIRRLPAGPLPAHSPVPAEVEELA